MPVHDWSRVITGTFHDFHNSWIIHIKESLNDGILPPGYYAQSEQHAGEVIADILALYVPKPKAATRTGRSSVATLPRASKTGHKLVARENAIYRRLRRTVTIRHTSGHRVVAMIEIVSPAN